MAGCLDSIRIATDATSGLVLVRPYHFIALKSRPCMYGANEIRQATLCGGTFGTDTGALRKHPDGSVLVGLKGRQKNTKIVWGCTILSEPRRPIEEGSGRSRRGGCHLSASWQIRGANRLRLRRGMQMSQGQIPTERCLRGFPD